MTDNIDEDKPQLDRHQRATQSDISHNEPGPAIELSAARKLRRLRLKQLAVVAAIVAAALTVLVVSAGGSSRPPTPGSASAITSAQEINSLLAGIPQHANTLGLPTAPVTLRWYGDLECPYCKEFTLETLPSLVQQWVRGGQLKIEYLSMETATREPKVFETQQVAALAAGLQNRMWNYVELFYHEQGSEDSGYVTARYLNGLASQVTGLNRALWTEDRHDPALAAQVIAERAAARRAHFRGTPTFFVGRNNATMRKLTPNSLTKPQSFNEAVEYMLRK